MDWQYDTRDPGSVEALARDVLAYLRRHATPDSDLPAADRALRHLLGSHERGFGGPARVEIDWSAEAARVVLHVLDATSSHPVTLPVRRHRAPAAAAPRPHAGALPADEEAREDGSFGRESFLRALVVQLAREVEHRHGPVAAEAAVAQVGADVGDRIEDGFRRARGLVERLTPRQMAELFVQLKHAIDGDFYVIEVTADRIILGNRRCPFGEVVRRAPSLCGVTASVFGGIAARNAGTAAVQLDRRIATGSPECRVTVRFGAAARSTDDAHPARERPSGSPPDHLRVVLADDYAYLRTAFVSALVDSGIEVVGHAETQDELIRAVDCHRPHAAIIDFSEADTTTAIQSAGQILSRFPGTGVLVLAEHLEIEPAIDLLSGRAGGFGFALKGGLTHAAFVESIRRVANGATALDPLIVPDLVGTCDALAALSPREREVLALITEGLSNPAIAARLVISKRAVEKHVGAIFGKLGLPDSGERDRRVLAALAFLTSRP